MRPAPVAPVFGSTGRLAFVAENRELKKASKGAGYRQWVVVDGAALPEADGISATPGGMQFSPDGRRFAYGRIERGLLSFVVDGVAGPPLADAKVPTFTPTARASSISGPCPGGLTLMGEGVTTTADGTGPGGFCEAPGPPVFWARWSAASAGRHAALELCRPTGVRRSAVGAGSVLDRLDGLIGPPLANLGQVTPSASIAFTPDGRSVIAAATVDGAGGRSSATGSGRVTRVSG